MNEGLSWPIRMSRKHIFSHSLLLPLLSLGTEAEIGTLSTCWTAEKAEMLLCTWPMLTLAFMLVRLCQNINRQAVLTWGDWEGEMRGAMLMPKGPQGLSAMEFACLGVV